MRGLERGFHSVEIEREGERQTAARWPLAEPAGDLLAGYELVIATDDPA